MLTALKMYIDGYRHVETLSTEVYKKGYDDSEKGNFRPLDCLRNEEYITFLYTIFESSDRVSAGEIRALDGMKEAMYGEISPLTSKQLYELIDRLASQISF